MKVDMVMPQMGESIAEATISRWLKSTGDSVEKDEIILEISTDKVDSEIPSPAAGTLTQILFSEGDVVPVKEKIAVIDTEGGAAASTNGSPQREPVREQPIAQQAAPTSVPAAQPAPPTPRDEPSHDSSNGSQAHASYARQPSLDSRTYSPLVKSLARKHGISFEELSVIPGSGQGGRVTKQDFLDYVEGRGAGGQPAIPAPQAAPKPAHTSSLPAPRESRAPSTDMPGAGWREDGTRVVPMDNMRQLIAEHMVRSKATSPHVYSVQEVDCSAISAWRGKYKNEFKNREGFSLSFTPFFLEAAVRGLLQFPTINSSVEGKTVVLKRHINLGCAVALGNSGLIVPVIKQAEERNFVGIARALNDLATRARDKKLLPDEVMGGTFTVTNPGVFGTMIGTPIINQPQVAILCLGQIKKRPVVIDDMIGIREICYLTLSYDHRIVDGALGGQYLAFIREYLENWDMDRPLY